MHARAISPPPHPPVSEPEPEVPMPRKVRISPFSTSPTVCSLLHRAIRTPWTCQQCTDHGCIHNSCCSTGTRLWRCRFLVYSVLSYPRYAYQSLRPPCIRTSRDLDLTVTVIRSMLHPSLKRVDSRRNDEQTWASTPHPRWSRLLLMPRLRSPSSPSLTSTKPCLTRAILIVCSLARHSQGRERRCKVSEPTHWGWGR